MNVPCSLILMSASMFSVFLKGKHHTLELNLQSIHLMHVHAGRLMLTHLCCHLSQLLQMCSAWAASCSVSLPFSCLSVSDAVEPDSEPSSGSVTPWLASLLPLSVQVLSEEL